jgi:GGDEF domain-containing protein
MQSRHLLDFQTLLVCESMMAVVFAIVFMGLQRVFPYVRGARAIAISFLLIVPDTLFVGLRGQVSPVVSVLIADTLMLASLIAMYEAILQFTGGVNRRWVLWFVAFVSFAVVYFYTDVRPQLAPRLIAIALSMAFVRANTAAALLKRSIRSTQRMTLGFFGLFMASLTAMSLWRAWRIARYGGPTDPLQQDAIQSTILVTGIFYLTTSGLCFLMLTIRELATRRRMEADWSPLPGMFNRRGLEVNLSLELDRLHRRFAGGAHEMSLGRGNAHYGFSIALVEIDSLSRVDAESIAASRRAMRDVGEMIASQLRSTDHIGRFSAIRYLLFFAQTDSRDALIVTERIAADVAMLLSRAGGGGVTLSIGIAEAAAGDSTVGLISRAELGVERARAEGGNCRSVVVTERLETVAKLAETVSAVA